MLNHHIKQAIREISIKPNQQISAISIKSTNSVNELNELNKKINGHLWSFMLNHHIKQAIRKISVIRI